MKGQPPGVNLLDSQAMVKSLSFTGIDPALFTILDEDTEEKTTSSRNDPPEDHEKPDP